MSRASSIVAYAGAATAARVGDAGAGLGIVLLAVSEYGARDGAAVGGALAASLTIAHLLGPWTGRMVDIATDPRKPLSVGCLWYAVLLAGGVALLRADQPWPAGACLLTAGAAGPLLTGGLSSLVRHLVSPSADRTDEGGTSNDHEDPAGRARSVDALTYGLAGTVAPAIVAALASIATPTISLTVVVIAVLLASVLLWIIPRPRPADNRPDAHDPAATRPADAGPSPQPARSAVMTLVTVRPLRKVTATTLAVAGVGGALSVLAIRLAGELTAHPSRGAWLVAATGAGNLLGALVLVARPQRINPVRGTLLWAAVLGVGYAAIAAVPTMTAALAVFFAIGAVTAPWVTATLSARDTYAPPGQRAQTFTAVAGLKIAAASAGTALAGLVGGLNPRAAVLIGAALVAAVTLACTLDRERAEAATSREETGRLAT